MQNYKERRISLDNAINGLQEGLLVEIDELVIDGVMYRFKVTFELAWKCMKDYLELEGVISKRDRNDAF